MPHSILHFLQSSDCPHVYLLSMGLTEDTYRATSEMPLGAQKRLAQTIIEKAMDEEILAIIRDLAILEFSIEKKNPMQRNGRFIETLLRTYMIRKEEVSYPKHRPGEILNQSLLTRQAWESVKNAAALKLTSEEYTHFMKDSFYPLALQYLQESFPKAGISDGLSTTETTQPLNIHPDMRDLTLALPLAVNKLLVLQALKTQILETPWVVKNTWFFSHPVVQGKRLPQDVYALYRFIEKAEKNKLSPQKAYENIVQYAQKTLDSTKSRDTQPNRLHQEIVQHKTLITHYRPSRRLTELNEDHAFRLAARQGDLATLQQIITDNCPNFFIAKF